MFKLKKTKTNYLEYEINEGLKIEIVEGYPDSHFYIMVHSNKKLSQDNVAKFMISFSEMTQWGSREELQLPSELEKEFVYVMRFENGKEPVKDITFFR